MYSPFGSADRATCPKKSAESSAGCQNPLPEANVPSNPSSSEEKQNRYSMLLVSIFRDHYSKGCKSFEFDREEIEPAARKLKIVLPKNLGDILYSFRYRTTLPTEISETAEPGMEWVIEPAGRGKYRMKQDLPTRIIPNPTLMPIKIPDATPQIVMMHSLNDEQAVLATVRYNRLIDLFLRVTAYSLQNHLRTTVPGMGQIETDELYVAVRNTGERFVVPVQAKGGRDQIGSVQVRQDLALCAAKFPGLTPRAVAVQHVETDSHRTIAMFELTDDAGTVRVVEERHYRLVPAAELGAA
jgi:hypothetical protein